MICQHGINAAQGIPAPLYTTLLPEQMAYIVGNAESKIVICDDETQLNKYISIAKGDSPIEHIVTMDDLGSSDPRVITPRRPSWRRAIRSAMPSSMRGSMP